MMLIPCLRQFLFYIDWPGEIQSNQVLLALVSEVFRTQFFAELPEKSTEEWISLLLLSAVFGTDLTAKKKEEGCYVFLLIIFTLKGIFCLNLASRYRYRYFVIERKQT
jgi:hypothetical protein